jgi:hypothetical protein
MMFTIEFFRVRKEDNAHATLDRVTYMQCRSPILAQSGHVLRSLLASADEVIE